MSDKKKKESLHDYFSIVVIGDSSVGKTCILDRYCNSKFSFTKKKQKSVEVFKKTIEIKGKEYRLKLWDSNYNDKINKQIYERADCIIIVCSVTNKESFENVENWVQLLSDNLDISSKMVVLMANKIDIEEGRLVPAEEIKKKGNELQMDVFEVSALESTGIDEAFEKIIEKVITNTYKDGGKKGTSLEGHEDIYSSKCAK